MRTMLIAVVLFAIAGSAEAAPMPLNCADPQSNLEAKMCASQSLATAEAELGAAFARAVKAAEAQYDSVRSTGGFEQMPDMPEALRKVERDWEAFRDANCAYQNLVYYGGSMAPLAVTTCRLDMAKARIKELNDLADPGK